MKELNGVLNDSNHAQNQADGDNRVHGLLGKTQQSGLAVAEPVNDLHHLNSILQPATSTNAPVVGVAITTEQPVAGCATGACHFEYVESAARFAVEVAKGYGDGIISFYDQKEYDHLIELYGPMNVFQTFGKDK